MDSLALLCNLYGQGPVTLRRLRDAGCRTCDDVLCLEPAKLARALRTRRPAAERFQREARELAARIGEFGGPAPAIESNELRPEPELVPQAALAELEPAAAAHEDGGAQLRPELLDGLDSSLCLRLRSLGIERVEDLARADALELARSLEVPVTRVVRLQFLARRLADARVESEPELRTFTLLPRRSQLSAARFSPSESEEELAPLPEEERMDAWAREQVREPVAEPSAGSAPMLPDVAAIRTPDDALLSAEASVSESEAAGPFA
jgi:predicted RecB family nuclease